MMQAATSMDSRSEAWLQSPAHDSISTQSVFERMKTKLDHRLGYCIILCLLTIATILFIYGLFYSSVYEELIVYINGTMEIVQVE